jgi:3-phenylpropionate/trans-cinnamate dioxygenase ferredoxin component
LDEGELCEGSIEFPWHHYRYDVRTGAKVYPRNVYPADLPCAVQDLRPAQHWLVHIDKDEIEVRV